MSVAVTWLLLRPGNAAHPEGVVLQGANISPEIRAILMRSCSDCHSDRTRFPWYSSVPFASKMIREDVERGREQLNLSRWTEYSRLRRQRMLTGIANQVKDRAMPLPAYLLLHPSAKLSDNEAEAVFGWAQKERLRLIMEDAGKGDVH
jgi:hypothetical protein